MTVLRRGRGAAGRAPYTGQQALALGVVAVLVAALINLLPWFLAVRGTPAGRVQALRERKADRIAEMERRIARLKAGKVLRRGSGGGKGRPSKGYERVPITGSERDFKILQLRKQIAAVQLEMKRPTFLRELAAARDETGRRYRTLYWVHWPSTVILRQLRERIDFTENRIINSPGARLVTGILVLVCWMPVALLVGVVLALRRGREGAHGELAACRAEGRLVLRTFLILEVAWILLYVVIYTAEMTSGQVEGGEAMGWIMFALPFVKLVQLWLVLRGCLALRVAPGRLLVTGTLAGAVLLHWIALLMIFEEFGHARELITSRLATAKAKEERARMLKEREEKENG